MVDGNESFGPLAMDVTLIQATVLDLNIMESQGPIVLVQAGAALIHGMNIFRLLFPFIQLIQNSIMLVLPKHNQLTLACVSRVSKVAWKVSSLTEICQILYGGSST